jgi:hypothetical protein
MKLPQLSLRDLFWLVLVAACLCGWWAERQHAAADAMRFQEQRADLESMIQELHGRYVSANERSQALARKMSEFIAQHSMSQQSLSPVTEPNTEFSVDPSISFEGLFTPDDGKDQ